MRKNSFSLFVFILFVQFVKAGTLQSFSAHVQGRNVVLHWQADHEDTGGNYSIEYSTDGKQFNELGTVNAAHLPQYEMLHVNPVKGTNYYRLKISGQHSVSAYSEILKVEVASVQPKIYIWPNPATGQLQIDLGENIFYTEIKTAIRDAAGKLLRRETIPFINANGKLSLNGLKPGSYTLELEKTGGEKLQLPFTL